MNAFVDKSDTITQVLPALYAALLELDEGIKKTKKEGLKYAYHDNEDVITACRRAMLNNGLMLHTNGGAITEQGKRLFQEFVFTITHAQSGEYVAFSWGGVIPAGMILSKSGEWLEDDKASGKLKSYSLKNWLLAEFMIGTPDQDTEAGNYAQQQYQQQVRQERTIAPPPKNTTTTNPATGKIVEDAFGSIPDMYGDDLKILDGQHKTLMAALSKVKLNNDDQRHNIVSQLTGGVETSSLNLTQGEFKRAMDLLKIWELGALVKSWQKMVDGLAPTVTDGVIKEYFALSGGQVTAAHATVLKWVKDHNITPPAKFNTL